MDMSAPKLQKPGAGLPFLEWFVSKYWVVNRLPFKMTWDEAQIFFEREGQRTIAAFESIPKLLREKKILIDRVVGMEDSSRYWSAAMVLEHLAIVGPMMAEGIVLLSKGIQPEVTVGIADVKPLGILSAEQSLLSFTNLLGDFSRRMAEDVANRDSDVKMTHPWYGPINARQLHWLMAAHHRVHRKQLEAILLICFR